MTARKADRAENCFRDIPVVGPSLTLPFVGSRSYL